MVNKNGVFSYDTVILCRSWTLRSANHRSGCRRRWDGHVSVLSTSSQFELWRHVVSISVTSR